MRTNRILVVTTIVAVTTMAAGLRAQSRDDSTPLEPPTVLFMCPHGAAKSVLASAYFERLAKERGLNVRVESAGYRIPDPTRLSRCGRSSEAAGLRRSPVDPTQSNVDGLRISRRRDFHWLRSFRTRGAARQAGAVGRSAATERGLRAIRRSDPKARHRVDRGAGTESHRKLRNELPAPWGYPRARPCSVRLQPGCEAIVRVSSSPQTVLPGSGTSLTCVGTGCARCAPAFCWNGFDGGAHVSSHGSRLRRLVPPCTVWTHHTQLLHAESQRVRVDAQALRGVARAVDPPAASLEDALDVRALHGVEIVRRFGAALCSGELSASGASSCSVSPVEAIIARSTTFSSSRTLPGHA